MTQDEFDNSEEGKELTILLDLAEAGENYSPDWAHGTSLIHEDYFEEYMDDMIVDCYELPKNLPCFMTVSIDYDMLKQDYTEVDFDGATYYIR